jgi:3-ketosteroid 9alpha-monooxygenase subunit B
MSGDPMPKNEGENPTTGPYYELTVDRVVRETHDSCSIVLGVPESLRDDFRYRAGQFLTFRVEVDGKRLVRCYSLASSPDADPHPKVTVKRVEAGRVSNHVNEFWREGDRLEVMRPAGVFCLRDSERPIWLYGAGSGITPVISIVKSALATTARSIRLLYANRDETSIIFRSELERLVAENRGRLQIEHSLDDRDGFVDVDRAKRFAAAGADADFYVCGPGAFMDVVERALGELSVEAERIFIERFELADSAEAGSDASDSSESDASGEGASITIVLDGSTTDIRCRPGETILQAARREGLEPPFACEESYCGCCMARVKQGDVEMKMNDGGINQAQIDQGWVLTCQAVPKTPSCRIEYPD